MTLLSDAAYVLHRRRFRETSLIVELLTHGRGRVGAVARGALRPRSRLGGALQPGALLSVVLSGRSELLTLRSAELRAAAPRLEGAPMYSLFYLNELVVRLTATHDQNVALFEAYREALEGLGGGPGLERTLRRFEKQLLDALGLGLNLEFAADTGEPIDAAVEYHYVLDQGAVRRGPARAPRVHGSTLLALGSDGELSGVQLGQSKRLMRHVLDHHLEGRPLASRELFEAGRVRKP